MFREFLAHLFPRAVRGEDLRLTYTYCLGGMAFTVYLALAASGVLLLFHYVPSPQAAFRSILHMETEVPGGRYLRSLHRFASHAFLALVFLHALRVLRAGAYAGVRRATWTIGFLLLCLALSSAYTGYLLPMDQLALWATQTGMELVRAVPPARAAFLFLVPDRVGGEGSLLRFYTLHILLLPAGILVLSMLHFYRIRKAKGVLPYL